nr:hypothetical protein [Tanacetum cinerariifolium]
MRRVKAKVTWEVVCLPKKEGSLGLRLLDIFNKPLSKIVSACDIHKAEFDMSTMIKDLFNNGQWTWHHDWISKYPALANIVVPNIVSNVVDELEWLILLGLPWVWNHIKIYAETPRVAASLNAIIDHIIPISKKKTTRSMIAKLVFAAFTYFIWQERNYRLFENQKRSPNKIIDCIKITVRVKLLTCKFKKTKTQDVFYAFLEVT